MFLCCDDSYWLYARIQRVAKIIGSTASKVHAQLDEEKKAPQKQRAPRTYRIWLNGTLGRGAAAIVAGRRLRGLCVACAWWFS